MKNLFFKFPAILLWFVSCTTFPGMSSIDTSNMKEHTNKKIVDVKPTLFTINASYLKEHKQDPNIYIVEPQDVLSIVVWGYPEFNLPTQSTLSVTATTTTSQRTSEPEYLVADDGSIYFPLVGYITAAGKTTNQIRDELTKHLSKYIRDPQLLVRVADYRSKRIYVFGEVNKPGFLPITDQPMTLNDALTQTGNLDPVTSDPQHIYVIRGDIAKPNIYWLNAGKPDALLYAQNFQMHKNDIVYVSTAFFVRWNRFFNQFAPTINTILSVPQAVWYTKESLPKSETAVVLPPVPVPPVPPTAIPTPTPPGGLKP